MRDQIVTGLDIGSTGIRLVVGQKVESMEGERMQIIGATSVSTKGINKGVITSIEDATSSISACIEKGERLTGIPINSIFVSINDPYIKCEKSKGVVAVGKSDGEINEDDVARVIEAARAMSIPPNYEILHVIPINFTIDNQENIKDPIGMSGIRLEVETIIIQGISSQVKNLTKAVYRAGLDIDDLILSPLAAASAVLNSKQKDLGVCLVNIGAATTSIAVFEEGELLHTSVLSIGSEHITSDIAIGLRCPINLAERIKLEYGSADSKKFTKKDEVDISDLLEEEQVNDDLKVISRKYLADIIEARVEEIFEKIDQEFKKIERSGMLPAGVFLVGGGSKLDGIVDVAKNKLRLPVCLGSSHNVETVIDKVNDLDFLVALGLVVWGDQVSEKSRGFVSSFLDGSVVNKTVGSIKGFFSRFMP